MKVYWKSDGWAETKRKPPQFWAGFEAVMEMGSAAVPRARSVPWTWITAPLVPEGTPSTRISVPGWMVRVWPAGTTVLPVTWTMPLQVVLAPDSVPETSVIEAPARLVTFWVSIWLPRVALSVKEPEAVPAPLGRIIALPQPLRRTIWLVERLTSGRPLCSVTTPSQRPRWIWPFFSACTWTRNGTPGR